MRCAAVALAMLIAALAGAPASALTAAEIARLEGPDRQRLLEQGARAEGEVMLYSSLIVDQILRPLAAGFEARYPGLRLSFWRGDSRQIVQRVLAERRAGRSAADVVEGTGIADQLVQAEAVEPFRSPELAAYPAEYRDPAGHWAVLRFDYYGLAFNSRLVAPAEAPRSYEALLEPRWRGKLAWLQENDSGALLLVTSLRLAWGAERAERFVRGLAGQAVIPVSASARTLVNRVIEGEYPMALNVAMHHALISAMQGAPSAARALEPVPALSSLAMLARGSRHPHAAMLLIDFLLSRDGQGILREAHYLTARPDVPPLEALQAIVPRLQGQQELFIRPEALLREHELSRALLERYFP